jgi:hypothetical protein
VWPYPVQLLSVANLECGYNDYNNSYLRSLDDLEDENLILGMVEQKDRYR